MSSPMGPVLLASRVVIRDIIKSSFDTDTVLQLLHWAPGALPVTVYEASSILRQQKKLSTHKTPASCVPDTAASTQPVSGDNKKKLGFEQKSYTIFAQTNYDERQWRQGILV